MRDKKRPSGSILLRERFPYARPLWSVENNARAGIDIGGRLSAYSINGRVVIVHDYQGDHGWTAYIDPFTTLKVDETFDAIAMHVADGPATT